MFKSAAYLRKCEKAIFGAAPPETDLAKIRKYCQAQVPARLRDQVRIEATVRGSSVTIFDCRPLWQTNLTEWSKVTATPAERHRR